ncbi:MAG: 4Fe-4S binding protein [Phycisphaeraceae bacterium]|nr:4Fe-4S binding protein [Phycisphaeraceae bacterium]
MPSSPDIRLKVLRPLRLKSHRYDWLRAAGMTVSIATLAVVPLLGIARVDLYGGEHWLMGEPAPLKHALGGVILGIAAMYVVTFLANLAAGRLFCGWGCPVGQVSRFGEATAAPGQKLPAKIWAHLKGAAFSAALVISVMAWWTDLSVLVAGDPTALAIGWSTLAIGVGGAFAHGRWWRWEFCKQACPIGLYYSFVAPAQWYGIQFDNRADTCIDCDACDHVCPVDLRPRELHEPIPARGGVSIHDAPGRNHCLECGDCVRACEWMIEKRGHQPVPLKLGIHNGEVHLEPESPAEAAASVSG